jgi:hypothetical protein
MGAVVAHKSRAIENLESLLGVESVLLPRLMSGRYQHTWDPVQPSLILVNRLFDKDAEGWAPKNEMDDELNKALDMFPVDQNQPMDFQMPDLSSVRRNRWAIHSLSLNVT